MQQLGLKSPVRLKKYRSYRGNMGLAAENILQRRFKAEAPCEKWVTDITEFRAGGQKLYLSPILDLFNGGNRGVGNGLQAYRGAGEADVK